MAGCGIRCLFLAGYRIRLELITGYGMKGLIMLHAITDFSNTRTGNFDTTVKNAKIDLHFSSAFPEYLLKSFDFSSKSQIILYAIVLNYQILKMPSSWGVKSPIPGMTPKFPKSFSLQ